MKTPTVALTGILVFSLLAAFTSCSGQSPAKAENGTGNPAVEAGAIVSRLGDSLWYIFQDKKNNLWFASNGQGVFRYNGKTIRNFTAKHGLCNDSIRQIREDESGNMYFSTLGGISKFDGERFTTLQPVKSNDWKLEKNDLWLCMPGKTVKWMFERDLTIVPNGGSFGIRSIFEDRQGSFWICNTLHRYIFDLEDTARSDRLQYRQITGIGNKQAFDGDEYIYYSHIIEDNHGDIWLTTWVKGVYKYDGKNITHYPVKEGSKNVNLVSMYKDNQGNLWLGTPDNGTFKFNGKAFERFMPVTGIQ